MLQRSHSLHLRGGDGDQGAAPPASPSSGPMWAPTNPPMWAPTNPQAPVHRSINVLAQDHHHSPRHHPASFLSTSPAEPDPEAHDEHDNRSGKASRLKAEQAVHLIPVLLFLCALLLWLATPSSPGKLDI